MVGIRLGNLSIGQIEREYGFEFTDAERERLKETYHPIAEFKQGESGWHMFDLPPFLMLSNGPVGREVLDIFMGHSEEMSGSFPAGFCPVREERDR